MRTILRAGTPVAIRFTKTHRQQFPHYCALWEGKTGTVIGYDASVASRGYTSVYVDGHALCIEHEHLEPLPVIVKTP
jgi:hypothetical protein